MVAPHFTLAAVSILLVILGNAAWVRLDTIDSINTELQSPDIKDLIDGIICRLSYDIEVIKNCTAEDFQPPNYTCDLQCKLTQTIGSSSWDNTNFYIEYSPNEYLSRTTVFDSNNINIVGADTSVGLKEHSFTVTATLTNYSAGYYFCNIEATSCDHTFSTTFPLIDDQQTGKDLGESCQSSTECLPLNAQCDSKGQCACSGDFNIPYENLGINIACFEQKSTGGQCNIEAQCSVENEICNSESLCSCELPFAYDDANTKCLSESLLLMPCELPDQCSNYAENSICSAAPNAICQCQNSNVNDEIQTCIVQQNLTVDTVGCHPEDFSNNNNCNLTCSVDLPIHNTFEFRSVGWIYKYSHGSSKPFSLNATRSWNSNNQYWSQLTLSSYNSGYYVCEFIFRDSNQKDDTYRGAFNIAYTDKGTDYHAPCTSATECATLYAECNTSSFNTTQNTCNCNEKTSVPYKDNTIALACVPYVSDGDHCWISDQCPQGNEDYWCDKGFCICHGKYVYVEEEGRDMCLKPVDVSDPCIYNEQCTINADCTNGYCECISGHKLDVVDSISCITIFTPGVIVGVVLAVLAAAFLVVAVVYCIVIVIKKKC